MAPRLKVSDDDYALLTEEERIGLKEHQAELEAELAAEDEEIRAAAAGEPGTPVEPAEPAAPAEPAEEEEEETDPEADPEAETEVEPVEEVATPAEEVEAAAEEVEPTAAAAPVPPAGSAMLRLTADEEARLTAIKTQLKTLAKSFDDGEITAVEWREQQETLEDERDALKEKRTVAALTNQTAVQTWYNTTIPLFLAKHTEYVDGSMRHKLLDGVVRELQTAANNPTDPAILVEAHKRITAELGEVTPVPPAAKKKGNGSKRETPPNFSSIPASDQTPVTTPNKFARLDKLNGVDYEKALAKLTPADREFYLQGGG